MPRTKRNQSPYASLIAAATGAKLGDLRAIESIMRDHVFHSTLDWQTEAELTEGAVRAARVLRENRALFDSCFAEAKAVFAQARGGIRRRN